MKHLVANVRMSLKALAMIVLSVFLLGCGTGEYERLMDSAIQSAPAASAEPAEGDGGGPADDGGADRPRGDQTRLGGRQSTIGMAMSAGARVGALNNMKNLMQHLMSYELDNGNYPAQAIVKDGRPLLSWRVELLKKIDNNLYQRFKKDEPWDSESNKALLDRMPDIYRVGYDLPEGHTAVVAVVGSNTLFSSNSGKATRNTEVRDNWAACVVVANSGAAVPWTKPEDFSLNTSDPAKGIAWPDGTFIAGFSDGSAQRVKTDNAQDLVAAFTVNGGESVNKSDL